MILTESPETKQPQICEQEADDKQLPGVSDALTQVDHPALVHRDDENQLSYSNPALEHTSSSSSSSDSEVSSTSSSDVEDEDVPVDELKDKGWLATDEGRHETANGVALPGVEPPVFGEVLIKNSTNVHMGNRTFCKGPVTIKQFIYSTGSVGDETKINSDNVRKIDAPAQEDADPMPLPPGKWYEWSRCRKGIAAAIVLIVSSLIVLVLIKRSGTHDDSPTLMTTMLPPLLPNDSSINNDPTFNTVYVIERVQWGAQPPVQPPEKLKILPPTYVIISHTVTVHCYTQAQCVLNVRVAQTFHIESKGWNDIAYNFLVGGDGLVYEGRGWDIIGAHTYNYNDRSIGISFIGTFNHDLPTKAQLQAAKNLISWGVKNGKIAKDYKLLGHRQCIKTESPGQALYNIIRTWDHWSPTP